MLDGDRQTVTFLREELARMRVHLEGLPADLAARSPTAEEPVRVVVARPDPKNPNQIGNMSYEAAARRALRGERRRRARQDACSPPSRAAPATPTLTARHLGARTSSISASATVPRSLSSRF